MLFMVINYTRRKFLHIGETMNSPKIEWSADVESREMEFVLRNHGYPHDGNSFVTLRTIISYISRLIMIQLGDQVEIVWPKEESIGLRVRADLKEPLGSKSVSNRQTVSMIEVVRPKVIELLLQLFPGRQKQVEVVMVEYCRECKGTGVIDTGNNDLPCDRCPAGNRALFNVSGVVGPVTGAEMRRHFLNSSPEPIEIGKKDIPAYTLPGR